MVLAACCLTPRPGHAFIGPNYVIEHEGRSVELETVRIGRDDYLDLQRTAEFFGFKYRPISRKRVRLSHPAGLISLRADSALVEAKGQPILLSTEVRVRRRRFYVPIDFVTRAVARLLGVEARHDPTTRLIRFDVITELVSCESFSDRTRVTIKLDKPPVLSDVIRDGRRRIVELINQELPSQVGGCLFDDTLSDLELRASAGRTRMTFFVGPRFSNLKVYELPDSNRLVFDFFNDSSTARLEPTPSYLGTASDIFDVVVLDPGHGGKDEGAVGPGGLAEKDLTLAIARRTAELLRDQAGLSVTLTRSGDEELSLVARTERANRRRADLFLSIHANAMSGPGMAEGAETYFLHLDATDDEARTSAAFENDAVGLDDRGAHSEQLEMLLWDMAQQQYLDESSRLAESVQRELNLLAGTADRGVKQANFLVLRGATMPAVLVEVGFISNPVEERRMRSLDFLEETSEALYRAVITFRNERRARNRR